MFKKFEEIHPSKLAAFIDGALSALVSVYFVNLIRKHV